MTEPRCDRTDLPVSMCAHCRGHDVTPSTARDYEPLFTARYDGRCAECDDPIDAGERIAPLADGSGYIHEDCI